jgi:hypothetical protein
MFQRVGMREGGGPLSPAFQYLILMIYSDIKIKRPCDLNLVMISSLASKCQHFKLTLASGIDVGPTFINFGFFSRPCGLIREYIKVV